MKRVVIVGAGPCGLTALKEMLEHGHDAILFERSSQLGGIFASTTCYPDLHLTMSNWAMSFSDFPDDKRLHYQTAEEYLEYIHQYTAHFDLEKRIRYCSEVCAAVLNNDGTWSIQIKPFNTPKPDIESIKADALIVATGAAQIPKPLPDGLTGFKGRVIHATKYGDDFKREVAAKKLRVLVVGAGESAADITAELGDLSPNVSVWLRRAPCVGPRYLTNRDEMQQVIANKTLDIPANGFLEAATTCRLSAGQSVYIYGFFRRILWHTSVLNGTLARLSLDGTPFVRNDQATFVTKNQRMCEAIHQKKVELLISQSITAEDRCCTFRTQDGTVHERTFDAILLCTGYTFEFPWIRLPSNRQLTFNPRSWFLHCFPPDLGDRLFFVGYARPHQGGIPVMAEMLCRYIGLLLRGQRTLPMDYADRAQRDEKAEREYYCISPDLHTLVDYNSFLESVARRVGCEPRLSASCLLLFNLHILSVLLLGLTVWYPGFMRVSTSLVLCLGTALASLSYDHNVLFKWWFCPHWSVWYRQRGPGARPGLPNVVLDRVRVRKSIKFTPGFLLFLAWGVPSIYVQRLLSLLLFIPHVVFEALGIHFSEEVGGLLRPKLFSLHNCPWSLYDLVSP